MSVLYKQTVQTQMNGTACDISSESSLFIKYVVYGFQY